MAHQGDPETGLRQRVVSGLRGAARQACKRPIYTLVATSLLASTTYIGLLERSIFEAARTTGHHSGSFEASPFLQGSQSLLLGQQTAWEWQLEDKAITPPEDELEQWALTTFVFPGSVSDSTTLSLEDVGLPQSIVARSVPSTQNLFSSFSHDVSIAFLVPFQQLAQFLHHVREIPADKGEGDSGATRSWVMRPSDRNQSRTSLRYWLWDSWVELVNLLKHAGTTDIIVMVSAYLSMHLTFLSLHISMRRLGSRFWLAASVLMSSWFAFFFGLITTAAFRVPVNMQLLSEGLPFLVVTVGFEKPIRFTRSILRASIEPQQKAILPKRANGISQPAEPVSPRSIQDAVQVAIQEEGFNIVRDYMIEISILAVGAASRVQGGLSQFCFLAAWILFWDCFLLFTFYATILCVKLEIERIRRRDHKQKVLEEDGILNDKEGSWSRIFGCEVKVSNVSKFKFFMVGGFVLFNILNLSSLSYNNTDATKGAASLLKVSNVLAPTPINPFKVAANGLEDVYRSARASNVEMHVTVLSPIQFTLESSFGSLTGDHDGLLDMLSGQVLGGILASFEDPLISKWVITVLVLSIVLNSYLINATRLTSDTHRTVAESQSDLVPLIQAEKQSTRTTEELEGAVRENRAYSLEDEEIIDLCLQGKVPGYALEKTLEAQPGVTRVEAFTRAVKIRRAVVSRTPSTTDITSGLELSKLPYTGYNYSLVHGACCENVIGYLSLPLGLAGPMVIDGRSYFIPMATTEGVLVASASRGCKAINAGGGAVTVLNGDGMTRGPCVGFPSLSRAAAAKQWLDSQQGQQVLADAFNSTSRFARLQSLKTAQAGTYLYIRFKSTTGDAMGMNMISKGVEKALEVMKGHGFEDMATITISGNYCSDKKATAINWIDGRGKSVVAEAIIPGDAVRSVLKTDVDTLVELNTTKNLIGSAMAGSLGGFNAHASNLVTAVFLATGQDPAQNVESSSCITIMKNVNGNLHISISMPSIEVGTIGGGTILEAQSAMLDFLGVRGAHPTNPGENARQLARIVAAAVLAGELSTCAALSAGHLVRAHMAHNRNSGTATTSTVASALKK